MEELEKPLKKRRSIHPSKKERRLHLGGRIDCNHVTEKLKAELQIACTETKKTLNRIAHLIRVMLALIWNKYTHARAHTRTFLSRCKRSLHRSKILHKLMKIGIF